MEHVVVGGGGHLKYVVIFGFYHCTFVSYAYS